VYRVYEDIRSGNCYKITLLMQYLAVKPGGKMPLPEGVRVLRQRNGMAGCRDISACREC